MSTSLKRQALKGLAWSAIDKFLGQLGYLALTIYLARLIGPESFGFIGMLTIFVLLTDSVVSGGFTRALVQKNRQVTEADCSTIFYINLGWGMGIYAIFYLTAPLIASFYRQPELLEISRVLFLSIIINSLSVVVRAKLTINVDFKSQAIANIFATIVAGVISVILAHYQYGYWALVWLIVLKSLFTSLGLWWFCRWIPRMVFSIESFRSLFGFGSNLMLAGFIATLVNNLYIALIGRFFNASQVGYFTQATNLSNYLYQFISSSLQGVTFPILSSIKDERVRLINVYKKIISVTLLVSLPTLVGFSAISGDFVVLFLGEEWVPAIPVLSILCLARAVTPISTINMNILNAIGRSDLFLKVDLLKLPMTLAALFIALPFGIEGLAWSMLVTSILAFFINAYFPAKLFGFGGWAQLKVASNYIVGSIVMFLAVSILPFETGYISLIGKITLGVLTYILVLLIMRDPLFLRLCSDVRFKLTK